jgi:hypothetical protein
MRLLTASTWHCLRIAAGVVNVRVAAVVISAHAVVHVVVNAHVVNAHPCLATTDPSHLYLRTSQWASADWALWEPL